MKTTSISIIICILIISCTAGGAWDLLRQQDEIFRILANYDNRMKLTIDNSLQNESFTDFPVLVVLNTGRITYSDISADGSGIKFISSDHSEELPYEIEEWNPGGESIFWVKISSISALSSSDYFWLYYSTDSNSDQTNSKSVWSNKYLAVWHMNETGSDPIKDSSSFGLDGIADLGVSGPDRVPGKISGAQRFDINSDNITVNSGSVLEDLGPVTFSLWMLEQSYDTNDFILEKEGLELWLNTGFVLRFEVVNSGVATFTNFTDAWTESVWSYLSISWTGLPDILDINAYENNGSILLQQLPNHDGIGTRISDTGLDLIIGNDSSYVRSFNGQMDEIRISNVVRTPAWISAQYLSMTDTFLTYGSEEIVSN